MASVALAVNCAVWLVLSFVGQGWIFSVLASVVTGSFIYPWFAMPPFERATSGSLESRGQPVPLTRNGF